MLSEAKILDAYWPVIEACENIVKYYSGANKHGTMLICPDSVGAMWEELNKAKKICPVKREVI